MCHEESYGGHFAMRETSEKKNKKKNLQCGFYWSTPFKYLNVHYRSYMKCQQLGKTGRRHELPMSQIQVVEVFDCWGLDFMRPLPPSFGYLYNIVKIDYISKCVKVVACKTNVLGLNPKKHDMM